MPNITAAMSERLPNMLPNISAICAAVLKDPVVGTVLVEVSDGKASDKEVDDENEIVDGVKLDKINEGGANDAVTKIDIDVVSGRVWVLLDTSGMSGAPEFDGN